MGFIFLSLCITILAVLYSSVKKYFTPKPFIEFVNNLYYTKEEISYNEKDKLSTHYYKLSKEERGKWDENPKLHRDKLISSFK